MAYRYRGDANTRLVSSYRADEPPFPTQSSLEFPRWSSTRDEVAILRQLAFPRCRNASALVDDSSAVAEKLTVLGALFHAGIAAYSGDDPTELVNSFDEKHFLLSVERFPGSFYVQIL